MPLSIIGTYSPDVGGPSIIGDAAQLSRWQGIYGPSGGAASHYDQAVEFYSQQGPTWGAIFELPDVGPLFMSIEPCEKFVAIGIENNAIAIFGCFLIEEWVTPEALADYWYRDIRDNGIGIGKISATSGHFILQHATCGSPEGDPDAERVKIAIERGTYDVSIVELPDETHTLGFQAAAFLFTKSLPTDERKNAVVPVS